ncbi:hypothetical protein K437DRAFT_161584 [Tilletiaria anomala UBC 951]|uniref:Calcium-channel protein CCH1 n=1 Tax=Tilletiaria anomala (strain ATCC 24038 / CBS 436.72 / UBC 951) TaxID=1037660 RepID=A0A066WJF2_TILAU|nr:uncharacterized protein K437DRAFT_161584 [Tilletiaria anomala UBC 951]KDN52688.1 hypothetical protein K437DRAFT_161584 [Tilletiaria anomala UBC 951]
MACHSFPAKMEPRSPAREWSRQNEGSVQDSAQQHGRHISVTSSAESSFPSANSDLGSIGISSYYNGHLGSPSNVSRPLGVQSQASASASASRAHRLSSIDSPQKADAVLMPLAAASQANSPKLGMEHSTPGTPRQGNSGVPSTFVNQQFEELPSGRSVFAPPARSSFELSGEQKEIGRTDTSGIAKGLDVPAAGAGRVQSSYWRQGSSDAQFLGTAREGVLPIPTFAEPQPNEAGFVRTASLYGLDTLSHPSPEVMGQGANGWDDVEGPDYAPEDDASIAAGKMYAQTSSMSRNHTYAYPPPLTRGHSETVTGYLGDGGTSELHPDDVEGSELPQQQRNSTEVLAYVRGENLTFFNARQGLVKLSKSVKRISRRVANSSQEAFSPTHQHQPLGNEDTEDEDDYYEDAGPAYHVDGDGVRREQDRSANPPARVKLNTSLLRGKSLGVFSSTNPVRISMARLLSHWWIEPLILAMIAFNAVVLIIQSARDVAVRPRSPGYFDHWEDYALLAIFCIFTIEIMAKIIVSGLIINPPSLPEVLHSVDDKATHGDSASLPSHLLREKAASGHHRREGSQSNTLESLAYFGDTLKRSAQKALKPDAFDTSRQTQISPNRNTFTGRPFDYAPAASTASDVEVKSQERAATLSHPQREATYGSTSMQSTLSQPFRQTTADDFMMRRQRVLPFAEAIVIQRSQAPYYAYLRHSWNRIDMVAVVAYWACFWLAQVHHEITPNYHIFVFRAISVLRCARLLAITSGTATILASLKQAGPLLVNVSFFTVFSLLLFSIIGTQAFKGSYRRSCMWIVEWNNNTLPTDGNQTLSQICGSYTDPFSGQVYGHVRPDGSMLSTQAKGYQCPLGQACIEGSDPQAGTQGFDNIFQSLLQAFIIISSNGWSQTLYDMVDANYSAASIFFIIGLIVTNFWMANLFVAVITNTFASITSQTNRSAFAAENVGYEKHIVPHTEGSTHLRRARHVAHIWAKVVWHSRWFWVLLIVVDVALQGSTDWTDAEQVSVVDRDLWFAIAFDVEMLFRFSVPLLDGGWRPFFQRGRNSFDLALAVLASIAQIPAVKLSPVYPWLTIFSLARFYRVILAVPRMGNLLKAVLGSVAGLLNMILFLGLMVGLACLIAMQLFRGDIQPEPDGEAIEMTFKQTYNGFLAMYQIFSSENWTTVLWSVLSSEEQFHQAVLAGIFLCGWFFFSNFIMLQMFIAVINENFTVAESEKRQKQLEAYLQRHEAPKEGFRQKIFKKLSPYGRRWEAFEAELRARGPQPGYSDASNGASQPTFGGQTFAKFSTTASFFARVARKHFGLEQRSDVINLNLVQGRRSRSSFSAADMLGTSGRPQSVLDMDFSDLPGQSAQFQRIDRHGRMLRTRGELGLHRVQGPSQADIDAEYAARVTNDPRMLMARFLAKYPSYDKSLFIFSNASPVRRFCQSIVPSSHGERLFGRPVAPLRFRVYQALLLASIIASIAIAGFATPAYRKWYDIQYSNSSYFSWFVLADALLATLILIELLIKVVADGFIFTPNAYLLSGWNLLDLFVLLAMFVNIFAGESRLARASRAVRALRLINLSAVMRQTFQIMFQSGLLRMIDAAVLAILYIIPYAVWGQNLFAGLLYSCNDGGAGIATKLDCSGEFQSSPIGDWTFYAPRVWQNPTEGSRYSFDDFKSSLLILFEIVSLEGWTNVMSTAMSIAGKDQQLQHDNRQVNAIFFVIYNLIGAVIVLTLFVSVIIENFRTFSGAAFLTTEQRQWIDLKRLIFRQRPSHRPRSPPTDAFRLWCYKRSIHKSGWWSRSFTLLYIVNAILLMTSTYDDTGLADVIKSSIYLVLAFCYTVDVFVRLVGLGPRNFFATWWSTYDVVIITGIVITTLPLLAGSGNVGMKDAQKVFLTASCFKLVQKFDSLNQLFKTAIASLPAILSLFALWVVLFLVWAILLLEVFGLTRWGPNETYAQSFSTFWASFVFLARMTTGENWNQYMHDYALDPPHCMPNSNYLFSDCGSSTWAYFLFISWNIISMYIFLNMFTGTVVENFSYVFQLGGKPLLTRQQIRDFKALWAEYDVHRSGYITRNQIGPFLARLSGAFEVRIYQGECSLQQLMSAAFPGFDNPRAAGDGSAFLRTQRDMRRHCDIPPFMVEDLNHAIDKLDVVEIRRRRARLNRLYHEALLADDRGKGVSFTKMLLILSSYKLINEVHALEVKDLIERRAVVEQVENQISLERVRGVLKMVYLRRRFLAHQAEKQGQLHPSAPLPNVLLTNRFGAPAGFDDGNSGPQHLGIATQDLQHGDSSLSPMEPTSASDNGAGPAGYLSPRGSSPRWNGLPSADAGSLAPPSRDLDETSDSAQGNSALSHFEATAWGHIMRRLSTSYTGFQQEEGENVGMAEPLSAEYEGQYQGLPEDEDTGSHWKQARGQRDPYGHI